MPTVSVVLNSYNQAPYLSAAIESVRAQIFEDWELLIIDNGSKDESPDIARSYCGDPRITVSLGADNRAVTSRMNQGVALARGCYVSFLYSDDLLAADKLRVQVDAFSALDRSFGVVYGRAIGFDDSTDRHWIYPSPGLSGNVFNKLLAIYPQAHIDMASPLIKRDCLLEHRFNERIFAEGEAILFRIALTHSFEFLDEPVVYLRDHQGNAGKAIRRNCEMTRAALSELRKHPLVGRRRTRLVDGFEARLLRSYAWQMARQSDELSWARSCLRDVMRLSPATAMHPRAVLTRLLTVSPAGARRAFNELLDRRGHEYARRGYEAEYEARFPWDVSEDLHGRSGAIG